MTNKTQTRRPSCMSARPIRKPAPRPVQPAQEQNRVQPAPPADRGPGHPEMMARMMVRQLWGPSAARAMDHKMISDATIRA